MTIRQKLDAAHSAKTTTKILSLLSRDKNQRVKQVVAWNPNTSKEAKKQMAKDPDWVVRHALADTATEVEILTELAKDPNPQVRFAVANNENTPPKQRKTLLGEIILEVQNRKSKGVKKKFETALQHTLQGMLSGLK